MVITTVYVKSVTLYVRVVYAEFLPVVLVCINIAHLDHICKS